MDINNNQTRAFILQTSKDYEVCKSEVKRLFVLSETYADFYKKLERIVQERKNNV